MGLHPLYEAALDADREYQLALVKEYGEYLAGTRRYEPKKQTPEIRALGKKKETADNAWRAVMAKHRREAMEGRFL